MAKFGDLINSELPVLIEFYSEENEKKDSMHFVIKEIAVDFTGQVKVIKIDADKNKMLVDALNIKILPTILIYNEGKKHFQKSGETNKQTIVELLKNYIK